MQLRKKILGHFLLALYFLVVLHHSTSHNHYSGKGESELPKTAHEHEDFKTVHHEHHFHVGIFHFLGHLLESINHSNDFADEHLIVTPNTTTKNIADYNNSVDIFVDRNSLIVFEVDAESLPDPPYSVSLLQKTQPPNTPLRAPPALV